MKNGVEHHTNPVNLRFKVGTGNVTVVGFAGVRGHQEEEPGWEESNRA
jgi:hypothetical protein